MKVKIIDSTPQATVPMYSQSDNHHKWALKTSEKNLLHLSVQLRHSNETEYIQSIMERVLQLSKLTRNWCKPYMTESEANTLYPI